MTDVATMSDSDLMAYVKAGQGGSPPASTSSGSVGSMSDTDLMNLIGKNQHWSPGREAGLAARAGATGAVGAATSPLEFPEMIRHAGNQLVQGAVGLGNKLSNAVTGSNNPTPQSQADFMPSTNMANVAGMGGLSQLANQLLQKYGTPTQNTQQAATQAGLPSPTTGGEQLRSAIYSGITGGALAGPLSGTTGAIEGGVRGAAGAGASDVARQAGAPELAQLAAGVLGGGPGYSAARTLTKAPSGIARSIIPPTEPAPMQTRPEGMAPQNAVPISLGLKLAPTSAGGPAGQTVTGLLNEARVNRVLSTHNAPTIDARVGEDLGLERADAESLEGAVKAAQGSQKEIRGLGTIKLGDNFKASVNGLNEVNGDVAALKQRWLGQDQIDSSRLLDEIRDERQLAFGQIKNGWMHPKEAIEGKQRLQLTNAMEQAIDDNLDRLGATPDLIQRYHADRQQLARIGAAQGALRGDVEGQGGHIFAGDLARQLDNGVPLDGNMRALAESWANHKNVMQNIGDIKQRGPFNFGEYMTGGFGLGAAGYLHDPHLMALAAAAAAIRPLGRAFMTSDLYQKYGVQNRSPFGGDTTVPRGQRSFSLTPPLGVTSSPHQQQLPLGPGISQAANQIAQDLKTNRNPTRPTPTFQPAIRPPPQGPATGEGEAQGMPPRLSNYAQYLYGKYQ